MMNSTIFLILKLWLILHQSPIQKLSCPSEGFFFTHQDQVDSFNINYPGCNEIPEFIVISGTVTNLDSLYNIERTGSFEISDADSLLNIKGLKNLKEINGSFLISNASLLKDLKGLDSLRTVLGGFTLSTNKSLESLDGLFSLSNSTVDVLDINGNPRLSICNIPFVCQHLASEKTIQISGNAPGCANQMQTLRACDTSQNCPDGLIFIESKDQLNEFIALFPNCSELKGSLYISYAENLDTNGLKPLSRIKSIGKNLVIYANPTLTGLNGLDSLRVVGQNLKIQRNERLRDVSALKNLRSVGGLYFTQNDAMEDISPFDSLSPTACNYLSIKSNPQLKVCNSLFVCQYIQLKKQYDIEANDSSCSSEYAILKACYPNMDCPPGDLILKDQRDIQEFRIHFPNCSEINGHLEINDSKQDILDLSPLNRIKKIYKELQIIYLQNKSDLIGLDSLTETGGLVIDVNPGLESLAGLENLNTIKGPLNIRGNEMLQNISALEGVNAEDINEINISENHALKWCGLETICKYIQLNQSPLYIFQNDSSCTSLNDVQKSCGIINCGNTAITLSSQSDIDQFPKNYPNCNSIHSLTISGADITNLDSLYAINFIGEELNISSNNELKSLKGLKNLIQIKEYLSIESNPVLENLGGLENLSSSLFGLILYNNPQLSNIDALASVKTTNSFFLSILYNPLLAVCDIPFICDYLNQPGKIYFVANNGIGCNSKSQIRTSCGDAQCPDSSVLLTTQAEVNAFKETYLECTSIPGDLTISGPDIQNLDSLNELISIRGRLRIENTQVSSLHGLENINSKLLSGIILKFNASLAVCEIKPICDYLSTSGSIYDISDNAPTCNSFDAIQSECSKYCYLEGLYLTSQEEVNQFAQNYKNCNTILGFVYISSETITNLDSLYPIKNVVGYLSIQNTSISSLTGLDQLKSIGGGLTISSNSRLSSLKSLANLDTIGGGLLIQNNSSLKDLIGLEKIHSSFNCIIRNNTRLTSLSGLQNLSEVIHSLTIQNNAGLKTLSGLDQLEAVGGVFRIQSNNSLDSIWGTHVLLEIGQGLIIQSNPLLKNLNGLAGLNDLGQLLNISDNPELVDITGLDNINNDFLMSLIIQNNTTLNHCSIYSICQYLSLPEKNSTISGNDTSCISESVVISNCKDSSFSNAWFRMPVNEKPILNPTTSSGKLNVYPNPGNGHYRFDILNSDKKVEILVTNQLGQLILKDKEVTSYSIDIRNYPNGVYTLILRSDNKQWIGRLIKK